MTWRTWADYRRWKAKLDAEVEKQTLAFFNEGIKETEARKCYLCGKKQKGRWERVKIGKRKHFICQECYFKHLREIKETGEIKTRRRRK